VSEFFGRDGWCGVFIEFFSRLIPLIRRGFLSGLCGVFAGLAATIFLYLLRWATDARHENPALIWLLPFAGLFIGLVYQRWGREIVKGNNLILDEIHDPQNTIPFRMAPLILLTTVVTHLFGGSAGREGTAVQMGASLSDQVARLFGVSGGERRTLLMAGTGAGFAAAIGAPWAGVVFGMEVTTKGRFSVGSWFECLVAAFVGYGVTLVLQAPHSIYPQVHIADYSPLTFLLVSVAAVGFGLAASFFVRTTHWFERAFRRLIVHAPLRPMLAGVALAVFFYLEGSYRYAGLGIDVIQDSLVGPMEPWVPLIKSLATTLTVGSGFKGGEFIPLVYLGATMGSAMASVLPVAPGMLAAVGFSSVFGAASKTPIACALMAIEIFGLRIAPFALVSCFIAFYFSGGQSIYSSQRPHR